MSYATSFLTTSILQAVAQPAGDPLWLIVLRDFPRDASAIVLYILLGGSLAFLFWANGRSGKGPRPETRVPSVEGSVESGGLELPRTAGAKRAQPTDRSPRRAA